VEAPGTEDRGRVEQRAGDVEKFTLTVLLLVPSNRKQGLLRVRHARTRTGPSHVPVRRSPSFFADLHYVQPSRYDAIFMFLLTSRLC
jgi:hypothetical protein